MRTFIDLKAALVRDKIDRVMDSLYIEVPKKKTSKRVLCYGVHQKPKSQFDIAA